LCSFDHSPTEEDLLYGQKKPLAPVAALEEEDEGDSSSGSSHSSSLVPQIPQMMMHHSTGTIR
jgi:hypothetical protein